MAEVKINSITKLFGEVKAVDNFNAVIRDGEFVSILGPSGCGKTTMLRMIAGFEKANEGEIYIGEHLVSSARDNIYVPPEKRNIGMVFQSYAVWPHMTVFENVAYPLKIKGMTKSDIAAKTNNVLGLVHLDGYAQRLPSQLSGGQQQRVALARALVSEPSLLLLDEPLSNLDAKLRESMRFEIKELQKKLNITVIYVTHDQAEAMAMSDRIIIMNKGVIQQIGTPLNIYENPVNKVIADFIGLANFLAAEAANGLARIPALGMTVQCHKDITGHAVAVIRPEHITLTKKDSAITGTLIHKFYLGDSIDCRIDVNGATIRTIDRATAFKDYSVGDKLCIEVQKINVFSE
jgi:iron(III) transport system ATP-binding protein